jgi:hypothetical protein
MSTWITNENKSCYLIEHIISYNGSFQKSSIPAPWRKLNVNPITPSDILMHLILSETNFASLPHTISHVGRVWTLNCYRDNPMYSLCRPNLVIKHRYLTSDVLINRKISTCRLCALTCNLY